MATFDPETKNLVLHVVYDGAPLSGKTASIKALGQILGRPVTTPEERDGRTLFFDWMDYEGGRRLGRPVQCRIVGVPGQASLARRRSTILAAADVVIFVVDSTPDRFGASLRHFKALERQLETRDRPIPVLVQVNKQDLPGALDPKTLHSHFGVGGGRRQVATVATEAQGVREAFVFAVGQALKFLDEADRLYPNKNEFSTQEVDLPDPDQLIQILSSVVTPEEEMLAPEKWEGDPSSVEMS